MEIDNELLEIFIDEINELQSELIPIVDNLTNNNQQPDVFLNFSQIIDRIYGTAITMGFKEIGEYLGVVKSITRKTGMAKIPRSYLPVFKLVKNCMEYFDSMKTSLTSQTELGGLITKLDFDIKKAGRIETEIFAFTKDIKTVID